MALIQTGFKLTSGVYRGLDWLAPLGDLLLRLYVANVFWKAGQLKIQSWDSTLYLFREEYSVPLLAPELAAYIGTGVELFFPVLLAFGLAGRFAAMVLFVFNIIAVVSYPTLNAQGIADHQLWGLLLGLLVLRGPGKLSLDHWLWPALRRRIDV